MVSCCRPLCNHRSCHHCAEHDTPSYSSRRSMLAKNTATSSTNTHSSDEGISAKDIALKTEACIRRDFGYPEKYHAGSFPWLLSAERQRTPMDDLDGTTDAGTNSA
ncbi:hypothetical protein EV175_006418, partial [Coemansia sp. RSA 1933]